MGWTDHWLTFHARSSDFSQKRKNKEPEDLKSTAQKVEVGKMEVESLKEFILESGTFCTTHYPPWRCNNL